MDRIEAAGVNGNRERPRGLFRGRLCFSPPAARDVDAERERAMLIAHTALWQLRELDGEEAEPAELTVARRHIEERLTLSQGVETLAPRRNRSDDAAIRRP